MERLDEDHAGEPLHERNGRAEGVEQEEVHDSAPAEDLLERDRPDERRDDERQHRERLGEPMAGEVIAREEQRERHGDDAAEHDGGGAGKQRVGERLDEETALEERGEVGEREPVRRRDGHDQHTRERIRDEDEQERENAAEERRLTRPRDHPPTIAAGVRSPASP